MRAMEKLYWSLLKNDKGEKMKRKGLSIFVGAALVAAVVLISSLIFTQQIIPEMERSDALRSLEMGKKTMGELDSTIQELIFEATGAKRKVELQSDDCKFAISSDEDEIKYVLEKQFPLYEQGTKIREGNVLIAAGPFIHAYEKDIDSDGEMDLVLENDNVLFAIKKIGTENSFEPLNTSDMITKIKIKTTGKEWVPKSGVYIDNLKNSSYGNGYIKLTKTGERLVSSGILVHVNSSSKWTYDAIFSLQGGADFVDFRVKMK